MRGRHKKENYLVTFATSVPGPPSVMDTLQPGCAVMGARITELAVNNNISTLQHTARLPLTHNHTYNPHACEWSRVYICCRVGCRVPIIN